MKDIREIMLEGVKEGYRRRLGFVPLDCYEPEEYGNPDYLRVTIPETGFYCYSLGGVADIVGPLTKGDKMLIDADFWMRRLVEYET